MEIERFVDEEMVRRVRRRWAFARDYGDWETMRACFHPDATVCVSWFSGPAATFFERTIAMAAERRPEERSKHWFGSSRVTVKGDRAILETDAQVQVRDWFDGRLFDLTAYVRMYDRVERRDGHVAHPAHGRDLRQGPDGARHSRRAAAGFFRRHQGFGTESGIAFMRFRTEKVGRRMPPELVIGGSENERRTRADTEAWLAG